MGIRSRYILKRRDKRLPSLSAVLISLTEAFLFPVVQRDGSVLLNILTGRSDLVSLSHMPYGGIPVACQR